MVQSSRNSGKPIGEALVSAGIIERPDIDRALAYKREHGVRLGQAFIKLGLLTDAQLSEALRQQGKMACIRLRPEIVDSVVAEQLGEEFSRARRAIAVNHIAGVTTVAMDDPHDLYVVDDVGRRLRTKVMPVFASTKCILEALDAVFHRPAELETDHLDHLVDRVTIDGKVFDTLLEDAEEMDEDDENHPVVGLISSTIREAYVARASDIHLETRAKSFNVRFRVDGTLYDRLTMPKGWSRTCISRLKIMSNLDIAQRLLPQDGRAQIDVDGRRIDLRIATTPTLTGENVVIRILDGGRELHGIENLGLSVEQQDRMLQCIEAKEGCMLATGPTGSGKTTTLYALLQKLHTPDRKIITLEDPVENNIDGITQINTNVKAGLTFSRGLRSVLRQDPDVVLVGEIRDQETAEIGIQAALTGHMVLSTLHTVGTAESITRLTEMGVERFLIADTVRGIVAQRLVRKVCEHCKRPQEDTQKALSRLGIEGDSAVFFVGEGCRFCHETGYHGRLGLYEIMVMEPEISEAVRTGASTSELRRVACENGMRTLRQEGIDKARRGETTLEEVLVTTAFGG